MKTGKKQAGSVPGHPWNMGVPVLPYGEGKNGNMSKPALKIKDVVLEALEHRGFSQAEAEQMTRRLIKGGEVATMQDSTQKMPFGKYFGWSLMEVPSYYLEWLVNQHWVIEKYEDLFNAVLEELKVR